MKYKNLITGLVWEVNEQNVLKRIEQDANYVLVQDVVKDTPKAKRRKPKEDK